MVRVQSFGFLSGAPQAHIVLDVRFLDNPEEGLLQMTGLDKPVRDFVLGQPAAERFLVAAGTMIATMLPVFRAAGIEPVDVAIGCTAGVHRSVATARGLAAALKASGINAHATHRDVDRGR